MGNNRSRLIGRVNYTGGRVDVLKVMDHKESDKDAWLGTSTMPLKCGSEIPG